MKQHFNACLLLVASCSVLLMSCQSQSKKDETQNDQLESVQETEEIETEPENENLETLQPEELTDKTLVGIWKNDNPWQGKGTERYKDFEELDFRADRTIHQDGRLIGTAWYITTDRDGDSVIEYISPRKRRPVQLVILASTSTTFSYGSKGGNGEYSLTKKQ